MPTTKTAGAEEAQLLSTKTLSRKLNIPTSTLADWRLKNCGPRFIAITASGNGSRLIRYRLRDVLAWLSEQEGQP